MRMIPERGDTVVIPHHPDATIYSVVERDDGSFSCDVKDDTGARYNLELKPQYRRGLFVFTHGRMGGPWRNK